jgi:hypothetical protein
MQRNPYMAGSKISLVLVALIKMKNPNRSAY